MTKTRKRTKKVLSIMGKSEIKRMYEEVFKAVEHTIGMNIYCEEYATLDTVVVMNDNDELVKLDCYECSYNEVIRQIKKQLIKNNLFITEMTVDKETLFIHTSSDVWSLIFVPEWDEEDYHSIELAKIQCEIEQENEPQEEDWQHSTNWEYYESKALEKAIIGKDEDDIQPIEDGEIPF